MASKDLQALHAAVLLGDRATADVLARLELPRICAGLRTEWQSVAAALIEEAAEDAVLWYLANPGRYDPARSALHTFLYLVARRKLTHALRGERRRLAHEVPSGLSMNDAAHKQTPVRTYAVTPGPDRSTRSHDLSNILALATTDAERAFVLAKATGANTPRLAAIVGAGQSPLEQRQAVHRVMARLRQRAKRRH